MHGAPEHWPMVARALVLGAALGLALAAWLPMPGPFAGVLGVVW